MTFFFSAVSKLSTFEASTFIRSLFADSATCQQHSGLSRGVLFFSDNQLQRLLDSTSLRWSSGANQLSSPKSGLNRFNRTCDWFGAIKEIALRSRRFSRGSEKKTWPKPDRKPRRKSLWHPGYRESKTIRRSYFVHHHTTSLWVVSGLSTL